MQWKDRVRPSRCPLQGYLVAVKCAHMGQQAKHKEKGVCLLQIHFLSIREHNSRIGSSRSTWKTSVTQLTPFDTHTYIHAHPVVIGDFGTKGHKWSSRPCSKQFSLQEAFERMNGKVWSWMKTNWSSWSGWSEPCYWCYIVQVQAIVQSGKTRSLWYRVVRSVGKNCDVINHKSHSAICFQLKRVAAQLMNINDWTKAKKAFSCHTVLIYWPLQQSFVSVGSYWTHLRYLNQVT